MHVQLVVSTSTGGQEFVSKQDFDKLSSQLNERFARFAALQSRGNIFTTPKMPVNVVPPPVSDRPFIDPSVVQATSPVLPSTSVKTSGSDKYKHKNKYKSLKKFALPSTSPVDAESKISSDTTIQPVVPGPGTQSTQPTYEEVVKTSQNSVATGSTSCFTGSTSNCTGLLAVIPVLPVVVLKFHLYQPSPLPVYWNDQRVDQMNLTVMMNCYLVLISQYLVKKGRCLKIRGRLVRT